MDNLGLLNRTALAGKASVAHADAPQNHKQSFVDGSLAESFYPVIPAPSPNAVRSSEGHLLLKSLSQSRVI